MRWALPPTRLTDVRVSGLTTRKGAEEGLGFPRHRDRAVSVGRGRLELEGHAGRGSAQSSGEMQGLAL